MILDFLCLKYGYKINIDDISAAAVSSKLQDMLLERRPPLRLDVLAAQAVRGQMMAVSGNILSQVNGLLEDGEITGATFDLL